MKKILKRILITVLALILVLVTAICLMFNKEIATINSIEKVHESAMYRINVASDYGLDEMIESGGVNTDTELVDFLIKKLLKGLPLEFKIPDFGCSTFLVQNSDGDWLFGRNYDLSEIPGMIVHTSPDNGYASISIANINVLGYTNEKTPDSFVSSIISLASPYALMDGMNEMGLSVGVLLIRDYEPTNQVSDKVDLQTTAAMRYLLDKAANVEEAIALLESIDMHSSANATYHFQIADAEGNSAVIEYIDNELRVIPKEDGEYQMLTNFLISEDANGHGGGQDRYEILENTIYENEGILSQEEAMDLLKAVSQDKINPSGSYTGTQWSVIYNNTKKTAIIVVDRDFDNPIEFKIGY